MRILVAANSNRNIRRRPRPSTGPRPGQPTRPFPAWINKYCWTHGHCNHTRSSCESKAPGHKNEATMENKMGGSTYGCILTNTWRGGTIELTDETNNNQVKNHLSHSIVVPPSSTIQTTNRSYADILKADSGATGHYLRKSKEKILSNLQNATPSDTTIRLPDQRKIKPSTTGNLPIPLPSKATKATVYPALKSASLLSIGQLCDVGCSALFTKEALKIFNTSNDLILIGHRNPSDSLWGVNLSSSQQSPPATATNPTRNSINVIMCFDKTKAQLAMYYHACLGSPVVSTFLNAIKQGFLTTWPGLTVDLIKNHLPLSIPTAKGHLRQESQNLRSTKQPAYPVINIKQEETPTIAFPPEDKGKKIHECVSPFLQNQKALYIPT